MRCFEVVESREKERENTVSLIRSLIISKMLHDSKAILKIKEKYIRSRYYEGRDG